jgi:predicted Holliday junction resolvase-like endonuclease
MIDSSVLVTIISIIITIISIFVTLVTLHDRNRIKDGVKSTSDALELELKRREIENKIQTEQQKLELERKKHEAREKWKKFDIGLKFLDILSRFEDED